MHNFYNFPEFLRHNAKWAVWRYVQEEGKAKPSKPPFHPQGHRISVNEPDAWASFDEAVQAYGNGEWWKGIGFLIEGRLNITVVDLDHRDNRPADIATLHQRIYQKLNSYSEFSPSGQGLHIVSHGFVPAARKYDVEVYSDQRFMSVTGNVLHDPGIADNQIILEKLVSEIAGERKKAGKLENGGPQFVEDDVIIQRGFAAANGDKFRNLWEGNWQHIGYPSQSEADFALINMLCYYTTNVQQIRRIFFQSALGQRPKLAERPELLDKMIANGFDRLLPEIDMSQLQARLEAKLAEQAAAKVIPAQVASHGHAASGPIAPPPGLLGELCQWYYQAAPYPAPEIALAGGMGFMAGLCGAGYQVEGNSLNLFLLLTAPASSGKDILTTGSHRLLKACLNHPIMFSGTKLNSEWISTILGPSSISSGQALSKQLGKDFISMLSIQREFGIKMQVINDPYANASTKVLREAYLNLAVSNVLGKEVWADLDRTIEARQGLAFTLLGESVPQKIYENIKIDDIEDGFIGRFMLIDCPYSREDFQSNAWSLEPNPALTENIVRIGAFACEQSRLRQPFAVNFTPEAASLANAHRERWRKMHVGPGKPGYMIIWSRCHTKVQRVAALIAVGRNFSNPVIEAQDIAWAVDFIERGTKVIADKFSEGEIGNDDADRLKIAQGVLQKYVAGKVGMNGKYYKPEFHKSKMIAKSHLNMICGGYKQFREDKFAFDRCYKQMLESGSIVLTRDSAGIFNGVLLQITEEIL